jgi:16S rRNA (cytosine967-C5)-methyltransferase
VSARGTRAGAGPQGRPSGPGAAQRARAVEALVAVERGGLAGEVLTHGDGRFVRELALGSLRRRGTLDCVHAAFGSRALDELDPAVRAAVRVGLYQLLFLDGVPPHAAVAETVGAVHPAARSYVNAVLRSMLRESRRVTEDLDRGGASPTKRLHRPGRAVFFFSRAVFPDPERDRLAWLAAVHSHPRFLVERWVGRMGEAAAVARMEADNQTPPLTLRPRAGRIDAAGLAERLAREGLASSLLTRDGGPPAVLVAPGAEGLFATRAFQQGLFSVQDAEQMDAAEILAPQEGEVVWDPCAAPGGKATQLAEQLEVAGRVVATDGDEQRLAPLRENVARLGLANVAIGLHDALADAPPPGAPERGFDALLVDAPCSNTAVLGRRPEVRWRLREETFARLADLQRRLVAGAARRLSSGGRLVYSVCSLEPEETSAHGLRPTRSPLVWTATAAELPGIMARWPEGPAAEGAA